MKNSIQSIIAREIRATSGKANAYDAKKLQRIATAILEAVNEGWAYDRMPEALGVKAAKAVMDELRQSKG